MFLVFFFQIENIEMQYKSLIYKILIDLMLLLDCKKLDGIGGHLMAEKKIAQKYLNMDFIVSIFSLTWLNFKVLKHKSLHHWKLYFNNKYSDI